MTGRDLPLVALAALAVLAWLAPEARAESGKEIFLSKECNECHSIRVEQVAVLPPEEGKEEEEEEALDVGFGDDVEEEDEVEPPDLSGVGKRHDSAWMTKFVTKKIETEEGKKHRKKFKGTDDELRALVSYLASLKTDAPEDEGK